MATESSYVIERFEGDLAVIETPEGLIDVPRAELPRRAREVDVLRVTRRREGGVRYRVDRDATRAALARNQGTLDALRAGDAGGDIEL